MKQVGTSQREQQRIGVVTLNPNEKSIKDDLKNQNEMLERWTVANGESIREWVSDIGSGLNYKRKNFVQLMRDVDKSEGSKIIIAHKDRLVRFGYEWFECICKDHDCEIVVVNLQTLSPEQEMTQDLLTIIHCFSSCLYGLRRNKNRLELIVEESESQGQICEQSNGTAKKSIKQSGMNCPCLLACIVMRKITILIITTNTKTLRSVKQAEFTGMN